jgi:hypothetical protein
MGQEAFREERMIQAAMDECAAAAVVVEGPGYDAKFLSEWLAAAVKVQAAWDVASEGPDAKLYSDVLYGELIHFGSWAIDFISRLRRSGRAVLYGELIHFGSWAIDFISRVQRSGRAVPAVLRFAEYEASHYFALMLGLGFFEAAADHYRMVIPNDFPPATLKATAMRYLSASLADSEGGTKWLVPHRTITTMSIADAQALQKRLIAIDKLKRITGAA